MKYLQIPGDDQAVIWQDDDGNSGVIRETDEGWVQYQQWLAAGHSPESTVPADSRSLKDLRDAALLEINRQADTALEPITRQYPRSEIDSWPEQCLEARAWLSSPAAPTPLIDAIAGTLSPEAKAVFCQVILAKADAYKAAAGAVIAWRRAVTSWVDAQTERAPLLSFTPQFPEVPHAS